nr:hypothetical protein [Abalone asfa-like virus]
MDWSLFIRYPFDRDLFPQKVVKQAEFVYQQHYDDIIKTNQICFSTKIPNFDFDDDMVFIGTEFLGIFTNNEIKKMKAGFYTLMSNDNTFPLGQARVTELPDNDILTDQYFAVIADTSCRLIEFDIETLFGCPRNIDEMYCCVAYYHNYEDAEEAVDIFNHIYADEEVKFTGILLKN